MITIRLKPEDEKLLRSIAEAKNIGLSTYVRELVEKEIEEEIDRELYEKAVKILEDEDAEYVGFDEAMKELGLSDEV